MERKSFLKLFSPFLFSSLFCTDLERVRLCTSTTAGFGKIKTILVYSVLPANNVCIVLAVVSQRFCFNERNLRVFFFAYHRCVLQTAYAPRKLKKMSEVNKKKNYQNKTSTVPTHVMTFPRFCTYREFPVAFTVFLRKHHLPNKI